VIGMCLPGGLPLNVIANPKVRAAVMSQPAIPFGGQDKQKNVGVSEETCGQHARAAHQSWPFVLNQSKSFWRCLKRWEWVKEAWVLYIRPTEVLIAAGRQLVMRPCGHVT
jgi:hypothetical protein